MPANTVTIIVEGVIHEMKHQYTIEELVHIKSGRWVLEKIRSMIEDVKKADSENFNDEK